MEQMTIFDLLNEIDPPGEVDQIGFDQTLKSYVMAAVKNGGYSSYFSEEKTEVSIASLSTSDNNKYFPEGAAMIHLYCISDKATIDFMIVNKRALVEHIGWVEARSYDHRYFTKYNLGFLVNEERLKPHIVSLESHVSNHFNFKKNDTYFSHSGDSIEETINDFYEWDF